MLKKLTMVMLTLGAVGGGSYYAYQNKDIKNLIAAKLEPKSFQTFEIKYSANEIMSTHRGLLLTNASHTFLKPSLHFYPYLLMEVKYSKSEQSTAEGLLLWSMIDGELVTKTADWEQTHGFEDCLNAQVNKFDFKIINALAAHGGSMTRKELSHNIHVESEVLNRWIESCQRKKLVVKNGNGYRLHFQSPKLKIEPQTNLDHWPVTQNFKQPHKKSKKYSRRQIEKIANLAFDSDFTIRNVKEIFLPVYIIEVRKPDGSTLTTHWNALNGKRLDNLSTIVK